MARADDDHARQLRDHVAAPLRIDVRLNLPQAQAAVATLTRTDLETVALLLAGMCDPSRDPDRALDWLTARPRPEHCDEDTEAPPLRVGG